MKYLESQPLHSSQKLIKETKDGAVYSFELHPTPEFDMAILSYGSQVSVVNPKLLSEAHRSDYNGNVPTVRIRNFLAFSNYVISLRSTLANLYVSIKKLKDNDKS